MLEDVVISVAGIDIVLGDTDGDEDADGTSEVAADVDSGVWNNDEFIAYPFDDGDEDNKEDEEDEEDGTDADDKGEEDQDSGDADDKDEEDQDGGDDDEEEDAEGGGDKEDTPSPRVGTMAMSMSVRVLGRLRDKEAVA